jgi:CheY-like chemotaxis protein
MLFGGRGKGTQAMVPAAEPEGWWTPPQAPRTGALIMAVDDDATSRAAIINALEAAGYRVHAVSNYADWESARRGGMVADLLVLDIMLAEPRRGGYEILRTLRKEDRTTPVVMVSSRHTASDEAFAKANQANAFVSKVQDEFDHPEHGLVAMVHRLLST